MTLRFLLCATLPSILCSSLRYASLLFSTLLYSTLLRYSPLYYSLFYYSLYATLLYAALLDSTLCYSTPLLYSTLRYSTLLYSTILLATSLYSTILSHFLKVINRTRSSFSTTTLHVVAVGLSHYVSSHTVHVYGSHEHANSSSTCHTSKSCTKTGSSI